MATSELNVAPKGASSCVKNARVSRKSHNYEDCFSSRNSIQDWMHAPPSLLRLLEADDIDPDIPQKGVRGRTGRVPPPNQSPVTKASGAGAGQWILARIEPVRIRKGGRCTALAAGVGTLVRLQACGV
jgi:hypothetical protein